MEEIKLNVNGMVCGGCEKRVVNSLSTIDGVKEVIANHNTAISNIREDELFYLNSKGISLVGAIRLIEDGYLYGILKKYEEFYKLVR